MLEKQPCGRHSGFNHRGPYLFSGKNRCPASSTKSSELAKIPQCWYNVHESIEQCEILKAHNRLCLHKKDYVLSVFHRAKARERAPWGVRGTAGRGVKRKPVAVRLGACGYVFIYKEYFFQHGHYKKNSRRA